MKEEQLHFEILRANQRDEEVITDLTQSFITTLIKLRITKLNFKQNRNLGYASRLLYFILTSLSSLQTLGEEYSGLIRVDGSRRALPNKLVHILWLMLDTYGELMTIKLLNKLEKIVSSNEDLLPDAKQAILSTISFLKDTLQYIVKIQQVDFYARGQYSDIPKRLAVINYRCVYPQYEAHKNSLLFHLLASLTFLNVVVNVFTKIKIWKSSSGENDSTLSGHSSIQSSKCVLCLEPRKNNCVTQCGHVFCWGCINNWCTVRKECPVCREQISSSRNILLQNY